MDYQLFVTVSGIFEWVLLSFGLFFIIGKLGGKKRGFSFVPGLRFWALGKALYMFREGTFCAVIDLVFQISFIVNMAFRGERPEQLFSLVHLIFFVFLFIYSLKLYLRINAVFGASKKWIILWICMSPIAMLIFGLSKKFIPNKDMLKGEDWEAGSAPAQISGSENLLRVVKQCDEGLSIIIRERTTKEFGKKCYLLKDIALYIPKKSLVLLLGGSGAGKTTMINAVTGYEKADANIMLNGADVYKDYESVKHKIGFVPQQNLIRAKDTVIKTVNDAAALRLPTNVSKKDKNEKINDVLSFLGLATGSDGLVAKKSGGQMRRICIATELVTNPELFVLDEPDSGLDGVISREIFTRLREVADQDRIVIAITHTPDRVVDLFDKVIVLGKDSGRVGRLAFYGSPAEAREFFGKESMEQIVMSVNGKDEGGEGRADEFIEKYASYSLREAGEAS